MAGAYRRKTPMLSTTAWNAITVGAPMRPARPATVKPIICTPNWIRLTNVTVRWMRPSATTFSRPSLAGVTKAVAQPIATA